MKLHRSFLVTLFRRWAAVCLLGGLTCWQTLHAAGKVVINEIMFHPSSENPLEQYVELLNATTNTVNLQGWQFTAGIRFTFTNSLPLAPGGLVVVVADTAVFHQRHPTVPNYLGNWSGKLAGGGEKVELSDAAGAVEDSVTYATGGDWGERLRGSGEARVLSLTRSGNTATVLLPGNYGTGDTVIISGADQPEYNGTFTISSPELSGFRYTVAGNPVTPATGLILCRQLTDHTRVGWAWSSRADGLGSSLELINPNVSNNHGGNWRPSSVADGTPGRPNSVAATNIAPLISEPRHFPLVPKSTDDVFITARLLDELTNGLTATLHWRVDRASPGPFTSMPMLDNGASGDDAPNDGVFGASLPPQLNDTVIEFYLEARDSAGLNRTWPAPGVDSNGQPIQQANALLQVDDTAYSGAQPIYRFILREVDRAEFQSYPDNSTWRQSNAGMNATFLSAEGSGSESRHLTTLRDRGAGTRASQPPNYRVSLPPDHAWHGVGAFALNTQYTHAQLAGYALATLSGVNTEYARVVQVRVNNANRASAGSPQYGCYIHLESTDGDYAAGHFPADPDGNLYRCQSGAHEASLDYLGAAYVPYLDIGYSKQSNGTENDWSDLIRLTDVLQNTPDATYAETVRGVANVEEWMRYFAVYTLLLSRETSLATGVGDDYSLYRGVNDPRFQLLAHDFDTILNEGDTKGDATASLFRMCPAVNGVTNYNSTTVVLNRFMRHPEFAPLYYRELKRLAGSVFAAPQLDATLDRVLGDFVPQPVIDRMKTFAAQRVDYVLSQIPANLTVTTSLTSQDGYPRTASATAALNGTADVIETRSVLVDGLAADWTAWQGTWQAPAVPLRPGINRVLVQALNETGAELARAYIDIWYDDNSTTGVGGTLSASATWTATAGPYQVTGPLTIPSGVTLNIEPGTTVYFATGAGLTCTGTGRLLAEGTDTQRIRFTRVPGAAGNWDAFTFNNATAESRIAYADFEFSGASNQSVHANNAVISLDHVTFSGSTTQYVTLENSSFTISHCVFPSLTGEELIHGQGLPASGHGIFDGNWFGTTTGLNDIIDFTGGQRPSAILQFYRNIFSAASDDCLDLDGTDAHIEGNIFLHTHQSASLVDSSSAISGGKDGANTSHLTIARNFFVDCDHIALAKEGNFYTLENNAALHLTKAGVVFDEPGRRVSDGVFPGLGAWLDGNIIWDSPFNFEDVYVNEPTFGTTDLQVHRSDLAGPDYRANGVGNISDDPRFVLGQWDQITYDRLTNALRLRAGSPAIGAGPNGLDMGAAVPEGASISAAPRSPTYKTTAAFTIGGPGVTHYRYRLNGAAWSAERARATALNLSNLSDGTNRVEVIGKNSAGAWQAESTAAARTWIVDRNYGRLLINEVLARNDSAVPHVDQFPDLIELYNDSPDPITLTGMGLTDNLTKPYKFAFPSGTSLAPESYLVLYADNDNTTPGIHVGFTLKADGDDVYLFDKASRGGALLDSVAFGLQIPDYSLGRTADGAWALGKPTFGAANQAQPLGDPMTLRINEWLADGRLYFTRDFLELYNPDPLPVALGGLHLTDNPVNAPGLHTIAALSFIAGRGFREFIPDGQIADGWDHLGFSLSPARGEIGLFTADLELIDRVLYGPQQSDVSQGRKPNGAEGIVAFATPTPGAGNPGSGGANVTTITLPLLTITNQWRYNQSGDLGTAWRGTNYNDSAWPDGNALFYVESDALPAPKNTPLTIGRNTYYFRTHFDFPTNIAGFKLRTETVVDDGLVVYLNGVEVLRHNMPTNVPITYATNAVRTVNNAIYEGPFELSTALLHEQDNLLAVEVHQSGSASTDVAFGLTLDTTRTITNQITEGIPVVLNEVFASNQSITNSQGVVADWVELYNPADRSVDLSDASLSDNVQSPRRWVFPADTSLASHARLLISCDDQHPASTSNTGFALASNGGVVYLFDTAARQSALLDSVAYGIQTADYSIGRLPEGTGPWGLNLPTAESANLPASTGTVGALRINEWMAAPLSGSDWFELHNPGSQPVELTGLFLTDDLTRRTQFPIRPLSFIGAGARGFLVFHADEDTAAGADHTNFRLSDGGESLGLYNADSKAIDTVSFGTQFNGVSEGRLPDAAAAVVSFASSPTPGASNYHPPEAVIVNEALTHTDPPLEDAIEFYNPTDTALNLGGWYVSNSGENFKKYQFAADTTLAAHDFLVLYEKQFNGGDGSLYPFTLNSAHGDEIWLSEADAQGVLTGIRAHAQFGAAENGVSFGVHPTSVGSDFTAMSQRTFGRDDPRSTDEFELGLGLPNAYPLVGPLVINEILFHAYTLDGTNIIERPDWEFVEIANLTAEDVELFDADHATNAWRLRGGISFNFPTNLIVPMHGFVVVANFDPTNSPTALEEFRTRFGVPAEVKVVGPFGGRLNDTGDTVTLYKPDPPQLPPHPDAGFVPYVLVDRVEYGAAYPWPDASTNNLSLRRVVTSDYGNDPVNWRAGAPTAGRANDGGTGETDMDHDGMPDTWEQAHQLDWRNPGDALTDADGDGLSNLQEYLAGTDPRSNASSLTLVVVERGSNATSLSLNVAAGHTYTVLFRDTLTQGAWQRLRDLPAAATPGAVSIEDNTPATGSRYYQVVTPAQP